LITVNTSSGIDPPQIGQDGLDRPKQKTPPKRGSVVLP
jgi:hypothetical protein